MSKKKNNITSLQPEHLAAIEQTEKTGTAMMQTSQQVILAIEDILVKEFHFTEDQLRHMETLLRQMLVTLANVEREHMVVLSPTDMKAVGVLAMMKLKRLEEKGKGILLPKHEKHNN